MTEMSVFINKKQYMYLSFCIFQIKHILNPPDLNKPNVTIPDDENEKSNTY